jgi:hypothetical protein
MGAVFFHVDGEADRETDTTKLIFTFYNFANATKNQLEFLNSILDEFK